MRKLSFLFLALTLSTALWAQTIDNVAYIDAIGQPQTADNVNIIGNASEPVTWFAGWYVVQGADITLTKGAVCNGAVNLILADDAKLTATRDDYNLTPVFKYRARVTSSPSMAKVLNPAN